MVFKFGENRFHSKKNLDINLMQMHISSGKIKQKIQLQYSELLYPLDPLVSWVKLIEKEKQGFLEIHYFDKRIGEKKHKKWVLVERFR